MNTTEKQLQTKLCFKEVSYYNDKTTLETPLGYQFNSIIKVTNGGYDRTIAVFTVYEPFETVVTNLEEKYRQDVQKNKENYDQHLNNEISKMNLVQELSDLLQKFKMGDVAYYYKENIDGKDDDILEKHIYSFEISSIEYIKDKVVVHVENSDDVYTHRFFLSGSSYINERKKVEELFKTKEEALIGLEEFHEARVARKLEEKKNADAIAAENQRKAELEILRKAEEIKAKSLPI